jgi:hypothetical protein
MGSQGHTSRFFKRSDFVSSKNSTLAFDSADMSQRGRIGAFRQQATHDTCETTRKARESFLARFVDEVDPQRVLPEAERQRRAEAAKRAYMCALARKSAQARRKETAAPTRSG